MMQVVAGLSTRYFRGFKVVCDRFSSVRSFDKFWIILDVCREPGFESVARFRKEGCRGC
jgi:hypothetical protein